MQKGKHLKSHKHLFLIWHWERKWSLQIVVAPYFIVLFHLALADVYWEMVCIGACVDES